MPLKTVNAWISVDEKHSAYVALASGWAMHRHFASSRSSNCSSPFRRSAYFANIDVLGAWRRTRFDFSHFAFHISHFTFRISHFASRISHFAFRFSLSLVSDFNFSPFALSLSKPVFQACVHRNPLTGSPLFLCFVLFCFVLFFCFRYYSYIVF